MPLSSNQPSSLHLDPINPCTLLSTTYFVELSISMLEIHEEPTTRDSSAPATTLHSIDPLLPADPAVRYLDGGDLQQLVPEYKGCKSPLPVLDLAETSVETNETNLSSEDKFSSLPKYRFCM